MNPSQLQADAFGSHIDDARRRAEESQRAGGRPRRRARRAPADPAVYAEHVVIRSKGAWDDSALERLSQLDSGRVPAGRSLVAEVRGELVAAIGIADGVAIADPFVPTADIVGLLRMRADQLRRGKHDGRGEYDGRGGLPALAARRLRALMHMPREERAAQPHLRAAR